MTSQLLKKIVVGIAILFSLFPTCIAQNDEQELNLKYWTMRERFRRYFISIGKNEGQGIPVAKRQDNLNGGDRCFPGSAGWMSWGDATGYLSDYMCMLATEYALLGKEGKNATATLNELYYAINALDRLDGVAENTFNPNLPINYNGFFLRDDVTDATVGHWNNEYAFTGGYDSRLNYQCLNSDRQDNLINEIRGNAGTNEPSLDQIVTIFQGFKFIQKYVPNIYVKPTPQDAGFNIIDKIKSITSNIMAYMSGSDKTLLRADQSSEFLYNQLNPANYFFASPGLGGSISLISDCADNDVRGNWILMNPVTNRKVGSTSTDTKGQDIRPFAWVLAEIGEQLTGNSYLDRDIHHKIVDQAGDGYYCLDVHDYHIPLDWIKSHVWDVMEQLPAINDQFLVLYTEVSLQKKPVCFKINDAASVTTIEALARNLYILEVLGAISGSWSHTNVNKFASQYNHENIDLIYSCLNDKAPQNSQTYYNNLLSKMSCIGPYNYGPSDFTPFWNNGNSFEHPNPNDNIDPTKTYDQGDYNANDWMWLYNMYRLKFGDNSFPSYDDNSCNCKKSPVIEHFTDPNTFEITNSFTVKRVFKDYLKLGISLKEYITQILYINNKTLANESELVICQGDVHVLNNGVLKNNNMATINDSVKIVVNEASSIVVHDNGELIVGTNSKVIIKKSANLLAYGVNSKITVKNGAKLIIEPEGLLDIGSGTKLTVESGGMIIIRPKANFKLGSGSKLIVEDGGQVIIQTDLTDPNANINGILTYNAGAAIQLKGDNAVLELNGRLHIGDNAIFTFTYPGSNSGYIKFNRGSAWWDNWAPNNAHITCGTNAKIQLTGQSKTDKIVEIHQINVAIPKNLALFNFSKGLVEFSIADARLETDRPTFINNSTFKGTAFGVGPSTRGLLMFGQKLFYVTNSDFDALGYGIYGALFYMGNKLGNVKNCNFTNCSHAMEVVGIGYNISNNTFFNNSEAILTWDNTYNSLIRNNNISTNLALNPIVDPNTAANGAATTGINVFGGTNAITEITKNAVNNIDMAIFLGNTESTLKCNDLQNNALVLYAAENSKTNMSDILGAGFNNGSNSMQFACFYEANYFEADNGYNAFDISDQNPCTTVYTNPGHIAHTSCPVITAGSIVNFTTYNTTTTDPYFHYYETVAENNFWRPVTGPQDAVIENEYNIIHKNHINGTELNARIVTGNALWDKSLVDCPFPRNGGGNNQGQPNLRVHPMDDNSNSSSITTASFYNKKLQAALKISLNKMDKLDNYNKVNEAADLLTEILKANYAAPVKNPVDMYLLELAYQKLFACVAQLTEWQRDSTGIVTPLPGPLQSRFDDLRTIIDLRINRKDLLEPDAKEVSDLIRLDKAMVYRLEERRTQAIYEINSILANQPKSLHKPMYEELLCLWSAENDAINGTISSDEAIARITACNKVYRPLNNIGPSSQRIINPVLESKIAYSKEYAIAVYPNPTFGNLNIAYSLQEFSHLSFELFDIQGKKMFSVILKPEERNFNIENLNLENGVYFYNITGDNKNLMTKKLVVVK